MRRFRLRSGPNALARFGLLVHTAALLLPSPAMGQGPGDESVPGAPDLPIVIDDDPDLEPASPARRQLGSWHQLFDLIATRSSDRAVALLEVERARGLRRQALGSALPLVTATGIVTQHFIRTEVSTIDADTGAIVRESLPRSPTALAEISVAQPILAPRAWYAVGTASSEIERAEIAVDVADRLLVSEIARNVVGVATGERLSEVTRVSLRAALERLELTRRARALGTGTDLDTARVAQDVALARSNVIAADEALAQAREALGLSLGLSEGVGVSPALSLETLERATRTTCQQTDPTGRSDVALARKRREIAGREVTDADLRYLPTADVTSSLAYGSEPFANGQSYAWSVQGVLTVPIWDGGVRYGARRAAEASVRQEHERVLSAERGATVEHGQALRGVGVATRAREVARDTRALAAETERLAKIAFAAGAATSFDLVDAGRRLREAELDLAVQELEVIEARIDALLSASRCDL
jgi:outer membrane protein TolC